MKNIQDALNAHAIPFSSIRNPPGRIVVLTQEEKALTILKNVFGISSLSFAVEIDRSMKKIEREALLLYQMRAQPGKTFRISTQRLDKRFDLTSQEVNALIGAFIVEKEHAQVNLDNPDIDIGVEIMQDAAYIFMERTPGYGGLPVGVQGKVLVNLEDKKSAVAAWMMLKRGCELIVCGDETMLPYLEPFSYGHSIMYVPRIEKAKNHLAVVFSELEFEKRKIPSFYPLLALTEQQIRDIENLIFKEKGAE